MANSQISLEITTWSHEAALALAGAAGNDPTYTLNDLQREIMSGAADLFQVVRGFGDQVEILGFLVLWVEDFGGTKELVLQSGAALGHNSAAVRATLPVLASFARDHGCLSMRAHVSDPTLMGLLRRGGFHKAETVLRMMV